MKTMIAACVLVALAGEPALAADTQVQLLSVLQKHDRQEFVGRPVTPPGVAMTVQFNLVGSLDGSGILPRRAESDHWTARCVGIAFSPDQVDTLSKLMYADAPIAIRLAYVRRYLTTRRFWFVTGVRDYTF